VDDAAVWATNVPGLESGMMMLSGFHWLRPWWLLALIPVVILAVYWWMRPQKQNDWQKICDAPLLAYFKHEQSNRQWISTWLAIMFSLSCMVLALAGPTWHKDKLHLGQVQKPVMILLELSTRMMLDDVSPNRLERAKFLIEDWLKKYPDMQWGMMVFSKMPFLVSPLTSDTQNILNFLPVLNPQLLPVNGYDVQSSLKKTIEVMAQIGVESGKVVVISSHSPTAQDLKTIELLSKHGTQIAWIEDAPIQKKHLLDVYAKLFLFWNIKYASDVGGIWLHKEFHDQSKYQRLQNEVWQWRDEGRWFLLLGMLPLVLVFRKGWFLRLWV
jgi:Ca-activated chloride channel homolog